MLGSQLITSFGPTQHPPAPGWQAPATGMHVAPQDPLLQDSPAGHSLPQRPQLRGSLLVSTHRVPHNVEVLLGGAAGPHAKQGPFSFAAALTHAPRRDPGGKVILQK
jgi:hypothetical protein